MRDLLLAGVVFVLVLMALRQPVVGAYAWAWLGLMNPHRAVFGFARSLPFAQVVALATMAGMLFNPKARKRLPSDAVTILMVLLLLWMSFTCLFAIASSASVTERWIFVLKIQVMLFITLMLVRGREQIERLAMVVTWSVGFYGIKGGAWTAATGGGGRVWGPLGGMIEGNNEIAVALVMCVPLMAYQYQMTQRRWIRWAIGGGLALTALGILGTQSRGALLAVVAMALFLGLKGRHPIRSTMLIGLGLLMAIAFMPDSWVKRMDTIQTYEADTSAMSRIYTWKTLGNCALDRPIVGCGFRADNTEVFRRYAPRDPEFAMFDDVVYVAHSIYFQMVGEHGFPGLLIFLLIGVCTWRMASRLKKQCQDDPEFGQWVPVLMPMVQVSIIGYAVGGAFLSIAYLDLPYYIVSLVVLVNATVRERVAERRRAAGLPPMAQFAAHVPQPAVNNQRGIP